MKLEEAQKVLDIVGQLTLQTALDVQGGRKEPSTAYGTLLRTLKNKLAEIVARDAKGSR